MSASKSPEQRSQERLLRRCQQLAGQWDLPESAAVGLVELTGMLQSPQAPTSVHDEQAVVDRHLADSLTGLEVDRLRAASRVADIGAGAGLPGLVLAIALPDIEFDLVEAVGKKCAFIEHAAQSLELTNVTVVNDRAETLAAGAGHQAYDAVTVRAVDRLATLLEYASPLLHQGGALVAWKGRLDRDEREQADAAAARLAMQAVASIDVTPYPGSRDHRLCVYEKIGSTPAGIPRRPGMASKRPLA